MIKSELPRFFMRVTLMLRLSHAPIGLTWVLLILIASRVGASPVQGRRPVATKVADEAFVVSGTLVRDDRTPIAGVRLMIAEAKDAGYAIDIGEGGVMQNPAATTDAEGRFSIAVRRSLFKKMHEFVVVVPFFGGTVQPTRLLGRSVTVKIDKTKTVYKLGKITHRNPVVRLRPNAACTSRRSREP
jgi:hypothetical protein